MTQTQTQKRITNKNGWKIVTIWGTPYQRGLQHGLYLHRELQAIKNMFPLYVEETLGITFEKYMKHISVIETTISKVHKEIYTEMRGISDGALRKNVVMSVHFIVAINAYMTVASMYDAKYVNRCSAFIATGSATSTGEIVMAHNTHDDFMYGQHLNIVMYIFPSKGNAFVMQTCAGFVASSTDWFICSTGIIGCETTIGDIAYEPIFTKSPYFCRIREAMQYETTLNGYVDRLLKNNAGDYACSWLLGNVNTNEIMRLELGLLTHDVQRTFGGTFYGMNSVFSLTVKKETKDMDFGNKNTSSGLRNVRLDFLLNEKYYGKIDLSLAKTIIGDHGNMTGETVTNGICDHSDKDFKETFGAIDGKVVDSYLAKKMRFMGIFGSSCGKRIFDKTRFAKHNKTFKKWTNLVNNFGNKRWTTFMTHPI